MTVPPSSRPIARLLRWLKAGEVPNPTRRHPFRLTAQPHALPEHFLDWDKPLNQQSEHVKQAIANSPYAGYEETSLPGGQLVPHTAAGMQGLADAGIPGIRYLDQGSRSAGQGSHNYVVFDANTIDILRKYGIAGLIAGGGAAAAGTQQQQAPPTPGS